LPIKLSLNFLILLNQGLVPSPKNSQKLNYEILWRATSKETPAKSTKTDSKLTKSTELFQVLIKNSPKSKIRSLINEKHFFLVWLLTHI
jgi:hypothetical protein